MQDISNGQFLIRLENQTRNGPRRIAERFVLLVVLLLGAITILSNVEACDAESGVHIAPLLDHGINITRWFRDPSATDDSWFIGYISDEEIAEIKDAGFTYIRLAIDPALLMKPDGNLNGLIVDHVLRAISRFERKGLGVVVDPHPMQRSFNTASGLDILEQFWSRLAPALRSLNADLTIPETLNEPRVQDDHLWELWQQRIVSVLRQSLPRNTIAVTGNGWGSIDDLQRLAPLHDPNVVYTVHFYRPEVLTTLMVYSKQHIDRRVLAKLPYPMTDLGRCISVGSGTDVTTSRLVDQYCRARWDEKRLTSIVATAAEWATRNKVRVVDTEFGFLDSYNSPARLAYLEGTRKAFELNRLGWGIWGYDDPFGFSVHPRIAHVPTLDPTILKALGLSVRP